MNNDFSTLQWDAENQRWISTSEPVDTPKQQVKTNESVGLVRKIVYNSIDKNNNLSADDKEKQKKIANGIINTLEVASMFIPATEATGVAAKCLQGAWAFAKAGVASDIGRQVGSWMDKTFLPESDKPIFEDILTLAGGAAGGATAGFKQLAQSTTGKLIFGAAGAAHAVNTIHNWDNLDTYGKVKNSIFLGLDALAIHNGVNAGKSAVVKQLGYSEHTRHTPQETEEIFNVLVEKAKQGDETALRGAVSNVFGKKVKVEIKNGKVKFSRTDDVKSTSGYIPGTNASITKINKDLGKEHFNLKKIATKSADIERQFKEYLSVSGIDKHGNLVEHYTGDIIENPHETTTGLKGIQADHKETAKSAAELQKLIKAYQKKNNGELPDKDFLANLVSGKENFHLLTGRINTMKNDMSETEFRNTAMQIAEHMSNLSLSAPVRYVTHQLPAITSSTRGFIQRKEEPMDKTFKQVSSLKRK